MAERFPDESADWMSQLWRIAQIVLVLSLGAFIVFLLISAFIIRDRDVESLENIENRYYYGILEHLDYTLTAPASGRIADLSVAQGDSVSANQAVLRVLTDQALEAQEAEADSAQPEADTGTATSSSSQGGSSQQAERTPEEEEASKYSTAELQDLILERRFRVREEKLEVQKLEGRLQERQNELESLQRLREQGAATESEVQQARAQVEETEFDLQQARVRHERRQEELNRYQRLLRIKQSSPSRRGTRLDDGSFRAHIPYSGEVISLSVENGDYVSRGNDLLEIVRTDRYRLSFQSHERLVRYFNPSSEVEVQVLDSDEEVVDTVELEIDKINRHWMTFRVEGDRLSPQPGQQYRIDVAQ